jgi:hypothetical protein
MNVCVCVCFCGDDGGKVQGTNERHVPHNLHEAQGKVHSLHAN